MAFEDLKAEIALLLNQMENQPEDRHELYLQIREKLNEMRAFGMPLPDDLVRLEKELEAEFKSEERAAKKISRLTASPANRPAWQPRRRSPRRSRSTSDRRRKAAGSDRPSR